MLFVPLKNRIEQGHKPWIIGQLLWRRILVCVVVILIGFGGIGVAPVLAQDSPKVQAQLISENRAIQPGVPFWVGVRMQIRKGWHTYWRNPGDSGAPTRLQWDLPTGFAAGDIVWPYPSRIPVEPLVNFGYKDSVLLMTQISPPQELAEDQITLSVDAEWLVCREECIPEEAQLSLNLPVLYGDPAPNPVWSRLFARTRRALPIPSPWQTTAEIGGEEMRLQISVPSLSADKSLDRFEQVAFFPYQDGLIVNGSDQTVTTSPRNLILTLERGYLPDLERVQGVLVIHEKLPDGEGVQAFEIEAPVRSPGLAEATESGTAGKAAPVSMAQILVLALLGGVTLNLMPCVFPVLSLKALSIARKSQGRATEVQAFSLVFTAGILASMAVLGGVLVGLKAVGQQIGWGFQLQSPGFVLGLTYLLFAVALSLSGVFQIGASWMGLGQSLTLDQGYRGEFFTGVLATVMSTPCTAPFMATALGAALTQPTLVSLMILQVLGIGLALPYLVLGFVPATRSLLPKPGPWMETLQQFLAFPMYGTVAWLIWVLTQQVGSTGLALALTGLIGVAFGIWVLQKIQGVGQPWKRIGRILAAIALGGSLLLTQGISANSPRLAQSNSDSASEISGLPWETYSQVRLTELLEADSPVFVNFSAAWCITCLVNDRVALSQPEVVQAFEEKQIATLKADWTNRDDTITQALSRFGRSGVPLYVFYPGSQGDPVILPQLLTPALVLESLQISLSS